MVERGFVHGLIRKMANHGPPSWVLRTKNVGHTHRGHNVPHREVCSGQNSSHHRREEESGHVTFPA